MPEPSAGSPSTCGCGRAYWAEPGDAAQCGMCRVTSMSQNAHPPTAEEEWVGEIVSAEEKLDAEVDAARRGVSAAENAHDQLCGHLYAIEYAETSDSAIGHQLRMARHALAAAAALIRQAYEAEHPGCGERAEATSCFAGRAEGSGSPR